MYTWDAPFLYHVQSGRCGSAGGDQGVQYKDQVNRWRRW